MKIGEKHQTFGRWRRYFDIVECLLLTVCKKQGWIKGGATGEIAPGRPLQEGPRDDNYLF